MNATSPRPNRTTTNVARVATFALLLIALTMLPGCAVIGGIFKAGVWVGIIAVVAVLALVGGAAAMFGGK